MSGFEGVVVAAGTGDVVMTAVVLGDRQLASLVNTQYLRAALNDSKLGHDIK